MSDIARILADDDYLTGQNGNMRGYWQDVADFEHPRKAWINSMRSKGERMKFNFLYSSEAIRDSQICASGFYSNLTNKATFWFEMETLDPDLMDSFAVRRWMSRNLRKMYGYLNQSNFDTTIQEYFHDKTIFGTAPFIILKDYLKKIRFQNIPIEMINIAENSQGVVDQMYRTFIYTARQAQDRWGDKAGKAVREAISQKKSYKEIRFLHYVGPRKNRLFGELDKKNMPFESSWICKEGPEEIEEGGYNEFPYIVGRFWKDSYDVFGFSPGMNVLADVKLLNAQQKTALRRAMKEADPPQSVPYKGFIADLNFNPSAINTRKAGVPADAINAIGVGSGQFSITQEMIMMTRQAIRDGFYVDLFNVLGDITKQMTVPEVQKKIADSMALLGPVVGREDYETLTPTLNRVYNLLVEDGSIDPPPSELEGQEVKWVFAGNLVKAQKMSEIQPITNFMTIVGGMASQVKNVVDNVDTDKGVRIISKILSVDPELIRDARQVEEIRRTRGEQEAMQAQANFAVQGAQTAKMMAEARNAAGEQVALAR